MQPTRARVSGRRTEGRTARLDRRAVHDRRRRAGRRLLARRASDAATGARCTAPPPRPRGREQLRPRGRVGALLGDEVARGPGRPDRQAARPVAHVWNAGDEPARNLEMSRPPASSTTSHELIDLLRAPPPDPGRSVSSPPATGWSSIARVSSPERRVRLHFGAHGRDQPGGSAPRDLSARTRAAASRTRGTKVGRPLRGGEQVRVHRLVGPLSREEQKVRAGAERSLGHRRDAPGRARDACASSESVTTTPRNPSSSRSRLSTIGRDCDAMRKRSRAG